MIKINKRPLPSGITITQENDYRSGVVFQMLVEDCNEKCYICEDSVHTSPNVEHRVSHKNDPALKYDWDNLFLSCGHCNNTKLDKYDGMIDPTQIDPEEYIELSLGYDDEVRPFVIVHKIMGDIDIDITTNLLSDVYNGSKTSMKRLACINLRGKLTAELARFKKTLEEFQANPDNVSKSAIKSELSDKSLFVAFKRKMVSNNPQLRREFFRH